MAKGQITKARPDTTQQPDISNTRKGQKRLVQPQEYDARAINAELDYVHERLNQGVVEDPPVEDLDPATATTAQLAERVNLLTELARKSGLLRRA